MSQKIVLKGFGRREEALAGAALSPGHLLEINSAGKVIKHNSEGALHERLFAEEDVLQGRPITTAYALNELVSYHIGVPGDVVYAYLKAGENAAIGDFLMSAGDGTLIEDGSEASGTTVRQLVGVAMEALDLSGSGAVATLLKVRLV